MAEKRAPWSFRKIIREIVLFAIILFVVNTAMNYFRAPKLDSDSLPHIQAVLVNGGEFDTEKHIDGPILISFWGTWCPVCGQEASNIDSVSKKYTVVTIAVNSKDNDNIKMWMKEKGVDYPVINDVDGRWAARFNVTIFPTNFIYDSKGQLKFTETGYSTTAGLMARMKLAE